jgi:hypothetical protein
MPIFLEQQRPAIRNAKGFSAQAFWQQNTNFQARSSRLLMHCEKKSPHLCILSVHLKQSVFTLVHESSSRSKRQTTGQFYTRAGIPKTALIVQQIKSTPTRSCTFQVQTSQNVLLPVFHVQSDKYMRSLQSLDAWYLHKLMPESKHLPSNDYTNTSPKRGPEALSQSP